MLKRIPFFIVNLFWPAIIGALIYILIREDAIITIFQYHCPLIASVRSSLFHQYVPQSVFGYFFKYHLGDLLWAYALEFSIMLRVNKRIKALIIGLILSALVEFFQLLPFVYATFDVADIFYQSVGVFIAWTIIFFYDKHLSSKVFKLGNNDKRDG